MIIQISSIFIVFSLLISNGLCLQTSCRVIRTCAEFQYVELTDVDENVKRNFEIKSESELAATGHWNGVVPISYDLFLNVSDNRKYEGNVKIGIDIVQKTNRISINVNKALEIDYRSMVIESAADCSTDESTGSDDDSRECIDKVDFLLVEETAVITLKDALEPGDRYVIHFPRFTRSMLEGPSAVGGNHSLGGTFVHCTPLRWARSLFPCFDHPSLKSTFRLCIERDQKLTVVTNTDADRTITFDGNRVRNCHEVTPQISTASFNFALLNSNEFGREKSQVPDSTTSIEIHFVKDSRQLALRVLKLAVEAMANARKFTQFDYPLSTFSIILRPVMGSSGCDCLGWATEYAQQNSSDRQIRASAHDKAMKQYLGNVVTVSDWRELCAQQGLINYLLWQRDAKQFSMSIDEVVDANRHEALELYELGETEQYGSRVGLIQEFPSALDSYLRCMGAPALFFHTLAQFYGDELGDGGVVLELLRTLFRERAYMPTSIEDWDRILEKIAAGKKKPVVNGYLLAWFTQPAMLFLLVSRSSADCIRIQQQVVGSLASATTPIPRPVPVHLHLLEASAKTNRTKPIILTKLDETICDVEASAHLVDPRRLSTTRKVYTASNYVFIFRKELAYEYLGVGHFWNLLDDFCHGLKRDLFPLTVDRSTDAEASWRELMGMVAGTAELAETGSTHHMGCYCCANLITHGNEKTMESACRFILKFEYCRNLRIARILNKFESDVRDEL